jgi:hypothetical protein
MTNSNKPKMTAVSGFNFGQNSFKTVLIYLGKTLFTKLPFALFLLVILLRVVYANNLRINSDEPQHLHIIWGWANGLMQYRDVFDNHAPLFHILFTPVYSMFGERSDILVAMRYAVTPLFFLALWAVYLIGKTLYSKKVGIWAALLTGLYPSFFMTSIEFRADDLWVFFWLLTVTVLIQKPKTTLRFFFSGLLLGAAFSTSMKTTLLFSALALACLSTLVLVRGNVRQNLQQYLFNSLWMIAGILIIPSLLVMYFDYQDALDAMYYGIIQHNIVPGLDSWKHLGWATTLKLLTVLMVLVAGIFLLRSRYIKTANSNLQQRRWVVFLTYSFSMLGLYGFWPLITLQDFLPLTPLVIVIVVGSLVEYVSRNHVRWSLKPELLLGLLVLVELTTFFTRNMFWHQPYIYQNKLIAEVLQLTRPTDSIMDLKGETVFRQRPFFYALESVSRKRIQLGLIKDSIAEDIASSGTAVATLDSPFFPAKGRQFLNDNFLPVGTLRVAGQILNLDGKEKNTIKFNVNIPAQYVLVAEHGAVEGSLDNTAYDGPRQLDVGPHTFQSRTINPGHIAFIWAPAIQRGFSPFNPS